MPPTAELTETDLALIEGLQVQPRASWVRIAAAIGIDASTAARRWARLTAAGLAWITAYPAPRPLTVGYLDVGCRAGALEEVTAQVRQWGPVFAVERTTGDCPLFLGVSARDLPGLDAFVTRRLGGLAGVRAVQVNVGLRVYREGGDWLVGTLDAQQRSHLAPRDRPATVRPAVWSVADQRLVAALGADARRSVADLARDSGLSETAVRRRLHRMITNREVIFRCDLSPQAAGWPVIATYRLDVAADRADALARALAARPETRLCCWVSGGSALLLQVWLRTPADCAVLEEQLMHRHPEARTVRRDITLHTAKRMGRLLDAQGRATGYVPLAAAPG